MVSYTIHFSLAIISFFIINQTVSLDHISNFDSIIKNYNIKLIQKEIDNMKSDTSETKCSQDITTWFDSLKNNDRWAWEMLDAAGKIPFGLLKWNINSIGNFDECIKVDHSSADSRIKGKYCVAKFPITQSDDIVENFYKTMKKENNANVGGLELFNNDIYGRITFNLGICIPDTCSALYIQKIFSKIFNNTITIPEKLCSTSTPQQWTVGDWLCASVLVIFVIILISSTAYDVYSRIYLNELSRFHDSLISFSIWTNTNRLLKHSNRSDSLNCLNGIRSISILWVILGHRYLLTLTFPIMNMISISEWIKNYGSMIIFSGQLAVDSFFFMSGLLIAYIVFKQHNRKQPFNLILFYIHRFLRLTPLLLIVVFIQATLYKHMGDGPLWHIFTDAFVANCQKHWWATVIYIQNYYAQNEMCLGHSWYLCVDTQLYVLSPILIYPLMKKTKFGIVNLVFWMLAAQIGLFVVCYLNEWPAATIPLQSGAENRDSGLYYATHMRLTPWLIGFATGYVLQYRSENKIKISKGVVVMCWVLCLTIMGSVIFGMRPLQHPSHKFSQLEDTSYNAFAKTSWTIALIWIVIACTYDYGGPINMFLSWRIWEIIGRLSYAMYLVHLPIQFLLGSVNRNIPYFSNFSTIYVFFGDVFFILLISYLFTITFELPIITLEKNIFQKKNPEKSSLP